MRTSTTMLRGCRAAALAACGLLLSASPALATPVWSISATHAPQVMEPGGHGEIELQAFNVGNANTSATYTIVDTLPAGVTPTPRGPATSRRSRP
jgi:hypothetical protein